MAQDGAGQAEGVGQPPLPHGAAQRPLGVAGADGVVTIPYDQISRSNLVPGD